MARVVYDFYMTQAARALEIACDSRKRKSYRLNRPFLSGGNEEEIVLLVSNLKAFWYSSSCCVTACPLNSCIQKSC